jgi:hypothetical protein
VSVSFSSEAVEDTGALRAGLVDVEVGVLDLYRAKTQRMVVG